MLSAFYESSFKEIAGYVVIPKAGTYNHTFGGTEWTVVDDTAFHDGPALLFSLDLRDPKLSALSCQKLESLPLCSYINSSLMQEPQEFLILPAEHKVLMTFKCLTDKTAYNNTCPVPNPLPSKQISLRPLNSNEYPVDRNSYSCCLEAMDGGAPFIRILNVPIWDENKSYPKSVICGNCMGKMIHALCMGYENFAEQSYIPNENLFLGEFILYFFFCSKCLRVQVLSNMPCDS